MPKEFHLGDVLSVTTGRIVSINHMGGVYNVLRYIYSRPVFTHELPKLAEDVYDELIRQHPFLKDISGDDITRENAQNG